MKNFGIIFSVVILVLILIMGNFTTTNKNCEYLRIHIRANSNSSIDQAVKYKIKDAIVDGLIPILAECESKEESIIAVEKNFEYIENIADNILKNDGFNYSSKAKISYENFPTRSYGNLTLKHGFYDALILELGEGQGDNWWCVVYPPLCFVNGSSHVNNFKSRILEIIRNFI